MPHLRSTLIAMPVCRSHRLFPRLSSPSAHKGPILAPRGSWLAVHVGLCPYLPMAFAFASLLVLSLSLSLDVYFLSSLTWAFNSDWTGKWPLSEAQMASHSLSKDFPP
jgi:hypothetical protein